MVASKCLTLPVIVGLLALPACWSAAVVERSRAVPLAKLNEVAFSNTLTDHAVLQNPIVIWGTGKPGSTVTSAVSGAALLGPPQTLSTKVGGDGIWRQALAQLPESLKPVVISSTSDGVTATLTDILIGKTILCSGQSNVDLVSVSKAFNGSAEVAACGQWPHIRIARTQRVNAWGGPLTDVPALQQAWATPSAANCAGYSATCFFTARELFLELGGKTAVGVVQSAAGGTAVRNWVPTAGLAHCAQPWAGLQSYGYGPYTHSTLYNAMIHPFGTGPTAFKFVMWDQAESDSYPQTMPGYYGCQTLAHVNSWRELLEDPGLPWIFVHLQPYTGSQAPAKYNAALYAACGIINGDSLAQLRSEQLNALALPNTGYANAIDLGDPTSPYGNVHFQNKQTISRRIVSAAMAVVFKQAGGSGGALEYPPPRFLGQVPSVEGCSMQVSFAKKTSKTKGVVSSAEFSLVLGATPDPGSNGSSAVCPPAAAQAHNCSEFELLCVGRNSSSGTGGPQWLAATPKLSADGKTLTLSAEAATASMVARGSRYAWSAFPQATLYSQASGQAAQAEGAVVLGLPLLPWNQALTCTNGKVEGAPC